MFGQAPNVFVPSPRVPRSRSQIAKKRLITPSDDEGACDVFLKVFTGPPGPTPSSLLKNIKDTKVTEISPPLQIEPARLLLFVRGNRYSIQIFLRQDKRMLLFCPFFVRVQCRV